MIRHRRLPLVLAAAALVASVSGGPARADNHRVLRPAVLRGREFVRDHCAGCHNARARGRSVYAAAPPFRQLGGRYTPWGLKAVIEDVRAGDHYVMPRTTVSEREALDVAAYIEALSKSDGAVRRKLEVPSCIGTRC